MSFLPAAWVVAAGHRPWYVSSDEHCTECQEAFEPLFIKYGVDLAMFGVSLFSATRSPTYSSPG